MKNLIKIISAIAILALGAFSILQDKPEGICTAMMVPVLFVDTTRQRAAYQRMSLIASKLNLRFNTSIIVNEDYFLSEKRIGNNISTYKFETWEKVMQTQTDYPLQNGVKDNDLFIGTGLRMYIDYRKIGYSNVVPQTYPNAQHFAASGATVADLWSVYNGQIMFQVGRTVYIPNLNTRRLLNIPQTQQTLAGNNSELNGSDYIPLDPYPVFSGRADNTLQLALDLYTGWAGAATTKDYENVISIEMEGLTVQNGADYADYFNGAMNIDQEIDKEIQAGRIRDVNGTLQKV